MNRTIFIILGLLVGQCFPVISNAQETDDQKPRYKNAITLNVTQLALMEVRLGYEKNLTDRHILKTSLGIQIPVSESYRSINAIPLFIPLYYYVSKGISINIGYNYFIAPSKQLYISPEIYYNYYTYDNKYYRFCTGQDKENYVTKQSMNLHKAGIKLLIGKRINLSRNKKTRLNLDMFAGIGAQYTDEETTIFEKKTSECHIEGNYTYQVYDPPEVNVRKRWLPAIHGGVLLVLPY